jgi:hypothetical protein
MYWGIQYTGVSVLVATTVYFMEMAYGEIEMRIVRLDTIVYSRISAIIDQDSGACSFCVLSAKSVFLCPRPAAQRLSPV